MYDLWGPWKTVQGYLQLQGNPFSSCFSRDQTAARTVSLLSLLALIKVHCAVLQLPPLLSHTKHPPNYQVYLCSGAVFSLVWLFRGNLPLRLGFLSGRAVEAAHRSRGLSKQRARSVCLKEESLHRGLLWRLLFLHSSGHIVDVLIFCRYVSEVEEVLAHFYLLTGFL